MIYQDSIIFGNEPLIIDANTYFTNTIDSLENFFNGESDSNSKNIISSDLSHFISSSIINIGKIINQCTFLKSLDIYNFDFDKISNKESISLCSKIY